MRKLSKYARYISGQLCTYLPNNTKRENKGNEFVLVLASAHKVGSTWAYKMLHDLNVFREWIVPRGYRTNIRNKNLLDLHKDGVNNFLSNLNGFRLYKSHSLPPAWNPGNNIKFLTVFRDPRDVVISNIFYLANLDQKLGGWPELIDMSPKERIRKYLTKGIFDLELMEKWFLFQNCQKIFYEEILNDPGKVMAATFKRMELRVAASECDKIVERNTFKKLSEGRKTGQDDKKSFFRKGVAGDWKNYFGDSEKELFMTKCNGRWNKLLVELGYEQSYDW